MIPNKISDQLIGALCNTLMHSLWQGILLAAIAGLIVIGTRKTSSALRYNLLISALMLFAVAVSATFVGQFLKGGGVAAAQPITYKARGVNGTAIADLTAQPAPPPGFAVQVGAYLQDYRNTIVMVWFLIICARSLQLSVGLYGTYRLKRVKVQSLQGQWPERMRQLAHALGITRSIALLESGLARTPMVIGHLKPVILVPVGLLTALSPQAIEAILIHELAHIKRRDHLVNMLQSVMEILFFFNPAVLWISTLIRTERENCCDDLAVAQDHNKANYIRALVSCEEYKAFVPPYAMAFPGGRNTLLHRVKRMVSNRNHSLNALEKTVLAVCLVGVGLFMTAFSSGHPRSAQFQTPHIRPAPAQPTPVSTQPASTQPTSSALTTPIRHKQEPVRKDTTVKPQPSESTAPQPVAAVQPVAAAAAFPDLNDSLDADPYTNTGYNNRPYRSGYGRYADQQARYKSDEAKIKIDLMNDKLVSDTNHIHFTLNERQFILNGVTQSPAVFQRYKDKYDATNGPGWSWTHGTER
jgi:bla regulator protein BlaR1